MCLNRLRGRDTGPADGSVGTRQQPSYLMFRSLPLLDRENDLPLDVPVGGSLMVPGP
ncbi:hypothetical protein CYFUS_005479 [Cystobacter fuscus]|uniref:Uncharacterized protein n=1 Tax=Cystobacter fuscus TaxID=43 RepID=A0A250J9C9_9BACT|nr:hypothetical protein CYFUS_005479 [Cystobacter fuscus]